jgi:hypothetical protein
MKLSDEQYLKVKQFYADPDWFLVKEMFMNYLEPLIDIRNVDHQGTALSVKGEIKAKIDLFNIASRFFQDADIITGKTQEYDNSME